MQELLAGLWLLFALLGGASHHMSSPQTFTIAAPSIDPPSINAANAADPPPGDCAFVSNNPFDVAVGENGASESAVCVIQGFFFTANDGTHTLSFDLLDPGRNPALFASDYLDIVGSPPDFTTITLTSGLDGPDGEVPLARRLGPPAASAVNESIGGTPFDLGRSASGQEVHLTVISDAGRVAVPEPPAGLLLAGVLPFLVALRRIAPRRPA